MYAHKKLNSVFNQLILIISLLVIFSFLFAFRHKRKPKVLVFSRTTGYVHSSIPAGNAAIAKLGIENGFDVDTTKDAAIFTSDKLDKYAAIVFLSTTEGKENLLNDDEKKGLVQYIHEGGGWVGIHAATDAGYRWPWYVKLSGALFLSHPQQQQATLTVVDRLHPSTRFLPQTWERKDEWYNFKEMNKKVSVLITIDEKSYKGGANGDYHPMSWFHNFEGGRAFYTELGHTEESFSDPLYLKHLLGGIHYAMDQNESPKGNKK